VIPISTKPDPDRHRKLLKPAKRVFKPGGLGLTWRVSPLLFAVAELISWVGKNYYAGAPEGALLEGLAAFLRVVTIYLVARGYILKARRK